MSILEQQIRRHQEALVAVLTDLVSAGAGIPRPIIGLSREMPFLLPVRQRALAALRALVEEEKPDFTPATLHFVVHPHENPASRRTAEVAYPYTLLQTGDSVERLDDGTEIRLVTLAVTGVPEEWHTERSLDLVIQARSPHRRYGEAFGVLPTINLRVPRVAIPGKESGV